MSLSLAESDLRFLTDVPFVEDILLRTDLAYFAEKKLGMEIVDHHKAWSQLVAKHKRLAINAPRDHGKTEHFSQLITLADGVQKRICDVKVGDVVLSLGSDWKNHKRRVEWVEKCGVKPCYKITTQTGREVIAANTHPFRKFTGWEQVSNLKVGDRIAVPRIINLDLPGASVSLAEIMLLGHAIANGRLSAGRFNIHSTKYERFVTKLLDLMRFEYSCYDRDRGTIIAVRDVHKWFLEKYNLLGKRSEEKEIPQDVYRYSNKQLRVFISALWVDGYIGLVPRNYRGCKGQVNIELCMASKKLVRQVHHLLLRLGIVSYFGVKKVKYIKKSGLHARAWRISVTGKENQLKFLKLIFSMTNEDEEEKNKCINFLSSVVANPQNDQLPVEVYDLFRSSSHHYDVCHGIRMEYKYEPSREKVQRVARTESDNEELNNLAHSDVLWDKIVSIEYVGKEDCWDLQIEEDHNYIIEDFYAHNSFFFSFAYVIWRLYYKWIPKELDESFVSIPRISLGYIFSATQDQAINFLDIVKNEIENNPELAHLIPPFKDTWSKTEIKCANGAIVRARGWGVRVRGAHPCFVVCDDVLNDESIYSEMIRKKQIDYFFSAVTPMLVPGGQMVVVGTPFHALDLYNALEQNRTYTFRRFAALSDRDEALWPTRYSKESLHLKKEEVGSTRFTREYLCLDGNMPIRTSFGYKPIRDIKTGELVMSHTGKFREVLRVFENPYDDRRMYKVITSNNIGHLVTEGHKLLVTKTNYLRSISKCSKTEWTCVEDIDARPSERIYLRVPIPKYEECDGYSVDEAYLAGWYVAEGSLASVSQQISLALAPKDDIESINKASINVFGKKFVEYSKHPGCSQWSLNSKIAKCFFSNFGKLAHGKKLPSRLFQSSREAKMAFLKAYFMGDGHYDGESIEATSTSKNLIMDISDLLLTIGIGCTIGRQADGGISYIEGRQVMIRDSYRIRLHGSSLDLFRNETGRRKCRSFVEDGFYYSRIKRVEIVPYSARYVYDLLVDKDHSYVGLHGTYHNCVPVNDESSLFPEKILRDCFDHGFEMPTYLTQEDRVGLQIYTGVDLALSSTVGADYTVITTIGLDQFKNKWILDIRRKKGCSMTEQLHEIEDVYRVYRPLKILIENNAFQRVFTDELTKNTDMPVEGFTTTARAKNDVERGVPSLQVMFENRKFVIARKTDRDRRITDQLVHELKCFTWSEGKLQGLGAHDDMVMSLWIAVEASNSCAFSYAFA